MSIGCMHVNCRLDINVFVIVCALAEIRSCGEKQLRSQILSSVKSSSLWKGEQSRSLCKGVRKEN